uniref:Uncharacterized protein n=1 Tax=Arundo donax TaxID=35708 RepID=A0A0A9F6F0_ARUDO
MVIGYRVCFCFTNRKWGCAQAVHSSKNLSVIC